MRIILVAIYSHVDGYPPSLNAIYHLSNIFDKIIVLERNYGRSKWEFPSNVQIVSCNPQVNTSTTEKLSIYKKVSGYVRFAFLLCKILKNEKPDVLLLYDGIPLALSYFCSIPIKTKLWYHNHDVTHESELRKYTFRRFLRRFEIRQMQKVDIFSLPTDSRLQFFPRASGHIKILIVPNYPSRFIYGSWYINQVFNGIELKLIHQGAFKPVNFETLLSVFYKIKLPFPLMLSIAGPANDVCEAKIKEIKNCYLSPNKVISLGRIPYNELPLVTREHHVGLALYSEDNIMVRTIGTASNKIFEYISLGLPVIFTEREDFRDLFGHYLWAYFVSSDYNNLKEVLSSIFQNYAASSAAARRTFLQERNFEIEFDKVIQLLTK